MKFRLQQMMQLESPKTTPTQVRRELVKRGSNLQLVKQEGSWYATGEETEGWYSTCIFTTTFHGKPAEFWADIILSMGTDKYNRV